jgi:membrane-bound metal-dependent hydrolase YbcI (DUF457 family)
MTGPTHKQYSVTFAFLANILLFYYGITEINYYLALPIMLLTSKYGALFPDVDHAWQNVKDKTVPNWIINKIIHLTGGKHRSWQTHSIDICALFTVAAFFVPKILFKYDKISLVNMEVMSIILIGFASGWVSHIFSDMLTSAGVRLICFLKVKIALVPKHIGKLRFNTGNEWEAFCFKSTRIINIVLGIFAIIYPLISLGYFNIILDKINNYI